MEKPREPETPPPGPAVPTETCAVPAAATSAAAMVAISWVLLTKVVERATAFQRTVEPLTKPLPLTTSVSGPGPAGAPPRAGPGRAGAGVAPRIAAVNWAALTKVVVRAAPFQRTVEPLVKPVPFTVSVKAAPPTCALAGARLETAGTGLLIENVKAPDVPPSGPDRTTVTDAVPTAARSEAGMAAVSRAVLTKVVVRVAPFHCTVSPRRKLPPFTVSVRPAPPTAALEGERELTVGPALATGNACAAEVPPPGVGVTTVTLAVPAAAMSAAAIAAVSWMGLTKVVVRTAPFQRTVEPFTNPVPSTVSVKAAPPTAALFGTSPVIVGMGLSTGNVCATEVPPPGVG